MNSLKTNTAEDYPEKNTTTATISTINEVSVNQWNALVDPKGFYITHEWIHSLELAHGANPIFIAKNAGKVVGAVPTWKGGSSTSEMFSLPYMVGDLPGPWNQPFLWLGGHRVTANALVCIKGKNRGNVLGALMKTALNHATKHQMAGVVWPYLTEDSARELASSCPSAQVILHSADPVLHIADGGLLSIGNSVRRRDQKKWRQELRRFENYGATIEWQPLSSDVIKYVTELVAANRTKYRSSGGLEWMQRVFAAQKQSNVTHSAIVALARVKGKTVAVAIFYRHNEWLFGRYWGAEQDAPPFSYYVLTHYVALDWAAKHGFRYLHLSIPAWDAKIRRGAQLHPLAMVVALTDNSSERISQSSVQKHNAHFVRYWENRFGTRREALDASWYNWV